MAVEQRFQCKDDSCDQPHCVKCGHHFDPACSEGKPVCDSCQVEAASDNMEQLTRTYGHEDAMRIADRIR